MLGRGLAVAAAAAVLDQITKALVLAFFGEPGCGLHRIAVTQKRMHEPAKRYLAQKQAEGKTNREALRCLKRQLVRKVLRTLRATPSNEENPPCVIKINNFKEPLQVAGLT